MVSVHSKLWMLVELMMVWMIVAIFNLYIDILGYCIGWLIIGE